jgi:hypothetical protein
LGDGEKVEDSFMLSVIPIIPGDDTENPLKFYEDRDLSNGWIVEGEGKHDTYGKFTLVGHVSIGGDMILERKGGLPKSSSLNLSSSSSSSNNSSSNAMAASEREALAAALAASQSLSRLERKRKREEAAALMRIQKENEECGGVDGKEEDATEGGGDNGGSEQVNESIQSEREQAEDQEEEDAEEEMVDPFVSLKHDFNWVYDARDQCNQSSSSSSRKEHHSREWLTYGHHWIGKRVRVGVGMATDASLPPTGSNFSDFVDGFIISWKPKSVESGHNGAKRKRKKNDSDPVFDHNIIMFKIALPTEESFLPQPSTSSSKNVQEDESTPFRFQYMDELEASEAMKMGGKRRAAVVKTNSRLTAIKEAAAIAAAEAEEKKDLELVCIKSCHIYYY